MERGDIYLVSLDPTIGHEQQGKRPVLVISPGKFNRLTGVNALAILGPTSEPPKEHYEWLLCTAPMSLNC